MRGCFKFGCIGCLVVAGLGVVAMVVIGALVGVAANREVLIEPIDSTHALSEAGPAPMPERPLLPEAPVEPPSADDPRLAEPGRILLDVSMCSFTLEPGPSGEPIRLEGRYDANGLEVSENWEPYGEVGWVYRLELSRRGLPFQIGGNDEECRMRLSVPRDTPFVLEGKVGIGQSNIDLGGLYVLDVDLEAGIGDHELDFSQPAPRPLRRLRVIGSVGQLNVAHVGHASAAEVEVRHSLGDATIDLGGAWQNDATIDVSCGMGACRLRLPDDAGIEVVRTALGFGESNFDALARRPPRPGLPTLRLSLSGKMGEFRIE